MRAREEAKASPEHGPPENSPPRSSEQSTATISLRKIQDPETISLRKIQDQESHKFQPNARSSPIFQGGLDWSDQPDGGSLPPKETQMMTTRPTSTIPASGKADGGRPISINQLPATWKHSKPTTVPQFTAGPRGVQSLLSIKATLMLCGLWYVIIPGVTDEYLNQQCWAVLTMALAGAAAHLKEKYRDPNDPQSLWDAMRKKALGETHASAFIAKQKLAAVRYDDNGQGNLLQRIQRYQQQWEAAFNKVIEFEPGYSPPLQDRITEYVTQLPSELMHVRGQLLKLPSIEAVIAETEAEAQLLCLASENKGTAATAAGAVGRAGGNRGRAGRARGTERSGRGKPRDKPSADHTRRTKCPHCKAHGKSSMHAEKDCWILHPEKKEAHQKAYRQRKEDEEKKQTRMIANVAKAVFQVGAVAAQLKPAEGITQTAMPTFAEPAMAFASMQSPFNSAIWDTGNSFDTIGIKTVQANPDKYRRIDRPPANAPTHFSTQNETGSTDPVLFFVTEIRTEPLHNAPGQFRETSYGPKAVTTHGKYSLVSAERHVQTHNCKVMHDKRGMVITYPNGDQVKLVRKHDVFLLPSEALTTEHQKQVKRPQRPPARTIGGTRKRTAPPTKQHHQRDTYHLLVALAMAAPNPALESYGHEEMYNRMLGNESACTIADRKDLLRNVVEARCEDAHAATAAAKQFKPSVQYRKLEAICGYRGHSYVERIAKKMGIKLSQRDLNFGTARMAGTAARKPKSKDTSTPKSENEMLCIDPMVGLPRSIQGNVCAHMVKNAHTKVVRAYPNSRNRTQEWIRSLTDTMIKCGMKQGTTVTGPKYVQSDSDPVATSKEMLDWLAENGIKQRKSAPYCKWSNWWIERSTRTVWGTALAMLFAAPLDALGFPREQLWDEALKYACFMDSIIGVFLHVFNS